eukprot:10792795-Karenia_brevis.AAC.1
MGVDQLQSGNLSVRGSANEVISYIAAISASNGFGAKHAPKAGQASPVFLDAKALQHEQDAKYESAGFAAGHASPAIFDAIAHQQEHKALGVDQLQCGYLSVW